MICMEVAGMKKALFKIIIPVCVLVLWVITCYPVCNKADGFDYFLYWILVGFLMVSEKCVCFLCRRILELQEVWEYWH